MSNVEITCACGCGRKRMVRSADVRRGWGKYYNKSCKAKHQERRTGQYFKYKNRKQNLNEFGFVEAHEFYDAHTFSNEE